MVLQESAFLTLTNSTVLNDVMKSRSRLQFVGAVGIPRLLSWVLALMVSMVMRRALPRALIFVMIEALWLAAAAATTAERSFDGGYVGWRLSR